MSELTGMMNIGREMAGKLEFQAGYLAGSNFVGENESLY